VSYKITNLDGTVTVSTNGYGNHTHNLSYQTPTGDIKVDSNGSTLIYDGTEWVKMHDGTMTNTDTIKKLMDSMYLYYPENTEYDETLAIVINNYVDFLKEHDFQMIDHVKVKPEPVEIEEDDEGIAGFTSGFYGPQGPTGHTQSIGMSGQHLSIGTSGSAWVSTSHTHANKSYMDNIWGGNSYTETRYLSTCDGFIIMRNGLTGKETQTLFNLYDEIKFVEKLSGDGDNV